ncbi:DUF4328 domain-containing protein [Streptomyces sp. NPDC001581]|uniref:DUF4328 domain-containing protein n=1 Tax=Streptomyces sp. NPDC001581 TaxID=3154386 RepID=UPI0033321C80
MVVLLTAVILSDLFSLYAGTRAHSLLDWEGGFAYASMGDRDAADARYRRAWTFQGQAAIVCGIVFIAWFHRMYRNAVALAPDRLRTGTGWAIGARFLPLVNECSISTPCGRTTAPSRSRTSGTPWSS